LPQSEQTVFVISLGPKFLGPPKLFLSIVFTHAVLICIYAFYRPV
jgi:hypothetical protein